MMLIYGFASSITENQTKMADIDAPRRAKNASARHKFGLGGFSRNRDL
jgi:hypothetical protein